MPPRPSAARARRWCCSPTSSATTRTRSARPPPQVVRIANLRGGEGFIAVSRRGAQELLARPRAHRRHRQAHQRLQDQRGRGDPAAAHGRLLRRHRAHQHRAVAAQQDPAAGRAGGILRGRAAAASGGRAGTRRENCSATASSRRSQLRARGARALAVAAGQSRRARSAESRAERRTDGCRPAARCFDVLQDGTAARLLEDAKCASRCCSSSPAAPSSRSCREIDAIHKRVLKSRVFVALHMHAGDGNVHTNIPVNSDDYAMLQEAEPGGGAHHALAKALGGVISGEHGIGITKLDFLEARRARRRSPRTSSAVDPEGRFNKGKLLRGRQPGPRLHAELQPAGTGEPDPGAERDRRASPIRSRTACAAASASRCAARTCRAPTCSISPRNKILATSLLIEAFLYEEQTRRGVSIRALRRVRRRGRPLHRVPQVREPLPGGHRLRRRVDRHAQLPAQAWARRNSTPAPRRRCCS